MMSNLLKWRENMETTTQVQTAIIISPGNNARFLAVVTFLMSLLLGCVGLTGIECHTFSKLQFEFDPLWHSHRAVRHRSLQSR